MANTDQTQKDMEAWNTDARKQGRYKLLLDLATKAGIDVEFCEVPPLRVMNMDPDKFMIHVYAMAKVRDLHTLAQKQFVQKPPLGRL